MRIDFNSVIKNLDGTPSLESDKIKVTLKSICITSLMGELKFQQGEKPETAETKLLRFILAQKINPGGKIDLTAEEITLLKQRIGKIFGALYVGRAYELLDPKEKAKDIKH